MIVAGRPKVRKKINCIYVYDIDTHMLGHGMALRGSWQEPVPGVVNTKKKSSSILFI
jgi:hypothetical protein